MTESEIVLAPSPRKAVDEAPWQDDLLNAQSVTSHLGRYTKALIAGGEGAVIALNGGYGTGKTFVLERWLKEMKDKGQVALYYNAWENDDDDDPLVSLLELLASEGRLSTWYSGIKAVLDEVLAAVLRHHTGVDVRSVVSSVSGERTMLLDARRKHRKCREELQRHLNSLVSYTRNLNGESAPDGVVIVIDELDRCRPTFAMTLLERTKHILNVPGIVFVLGIDMKSLRKFVKIVYGDIDASGYLLRMFNIVLNMPDGISFNEPGASGGDAWMGYLRKLAERHRLMLENTPVLKAQLDDAFRILSLVAEHGGFTPREMEMVVGVLVRAAWLSSDLAPQGRFHRLLPELVVPMVIAKLKNPDAYLRMVSRPNGAPEVIDCVRKLVDEGGITDWVKEALDSMEMMLYRACHPRSDMGQPLAHSALDKLARGRELTEDEHAALSSRAAQMDKAQASALLQKKIKHMHSDGRTGGPYPIGFGTVRGIASRIDSVRSTA